MSQIKVRILFVLGIVLLSVASGCSDARKNNNQFDPNTGKHGSNWLPFAHKEAAIADSSGSLSSRSSTTGSAGINCTECHGADLSGGISGVSCASCHLGGATNVHPVDWNPVYLMHGPYANTRGTQPCSSRYCHGSDLGGVAQSGPSCTSCHLGGATSVHPSSWETVALSHAAYTGSNGTASCANQVCHGAALNGVTQSGPSCSSCHLGGNTGVHPAIWNPVSLDHGLYAKTNTTKSCANQYCHGAKLTGVAQSGPSCSSCHLGGSTSVHPADWTSAALSHKSFVDKNGVLGCSNAACHGTSLTGVPRSGPACNSCHLGGTDKVHPDTWSTVSLNHGPFVSANGTSSCANQYCHGGNLQGVPGSGPSCTSCHLGDASHVHPLSWKTVPLDHGPYANTNGRATCANTACHGASLTGVAQSGPSCSLCHMGGATSVHPTGWNPVSQGHAPYITINGTTACATQYCHGTGLAGVTQSGPSCSSCHLGGNARVHPANWSPIYSTHGPYANATGTASCSNAACHGTTLAGVSGSGPACTFCHSWPYSAATVTCGACHRIPPSGNAYPDLAGKHAKHATSDVHSCDICHNGASGYVGDHSNGTIDMAFQAAYTPKSGGTPSYNAMTDACSNVSCHGASRTQTFTQATSTVPDSTITQTPSWYSGAIDVNTQCTVCHVFGAVEYNSYSSGQHFAHLWDPNNGPLPVPSPPAQKIACTVCHDVALLGAIHFVGLNTPGLDNPAWVTLNSQLNWNSTLLRCTPDPVSMTGCHGTKSW